jgi:DNA gyrase subunit A
VPLRLFLIFDFPVILNTITMNNENNLNSEHQMDENSIRISEGHKNDPHPDSRPIKVSDDLNSKEILVFTTLNNVYKVQKKEIMEKFQALQKIDFEPGEKPIYLTGEKHYKGYLIVAFENGKMGKISMKGFETEYARKKLKNAFNGESKLIFIELIEHDIDLVAMSSIKKVVLFNTSQINPVESRTTKGVQIMKPKAGSSMIMVKRLEHTRLTEPEYYRKSEGLNVVGFYLKAGDEMT